ncbi:response regulator with CheY-like receiver [Pseudomonas sp. StFLB209]|uniref:response regulator n=1 Tax=Pseudomonas sp. StFLB209 TaxID=1028989 RepID=UPI0004F65F4E|nr:response regulator [Pseudomonas sp. StFLB209]BAP41639.1 response regulator with CheY-like receiver [Pseudomonas sp. StFLB209]
MTTILIVDDEYLIAEILSFALEDEGFLTVTAGTAQKALTILDRERPGLIITDYMMPGMNGMEFAAAVRENPQFSTIPIVLMSGAQAHLGSARPELFTKVFEKPFEIEAMVESVKKLLNE